jgi:glycerol-3-phosphate cytidylyltransferase
MRRIMTAGTFDLIHYGHINILLKAKSLGDYLIVAVSTDKLVKSYKGTAPIISYRDRAALIRELKCVDLVVPQRKLVDIKQVNKLKADLFVLGDDWKDNYSNEGLNQLRKEERVRFFPYTQRLSTSKIKKDIIRNSYDILKGLIERG